MALTIPRSSVGGASRPADAVVAPRARSMTATKAFLISLPPFAMYSGNARISLGCCERGSGARATPRHGKPGKRHVPSLRSRVVFDPPFLLWKDVKSRKVRSSTRQNVVRTHASESKFDDCVTDKRP